MPHVRLKEGFPKGLDFYAEKLDIDSIRNMVEDFKAGHVITLFSNIIGDATRELSRSDLSDADFYQSIADFYGE